MIIYLSGTGGRVVLPTADCVDDHPADPSLVRLLDGNGAEIAIFRREDVILYGDVDVGPSAIDLEE